ncbi:CG31609 [Drosophila busckii]|uniref:CG31609 n=1 Tax=Drosophila busckii TaxID=30019 RepID=A0A0M3QTK4_DROBS|nr:CG31609 [Drosophila busckii]
MNLLSIIGVLLWALVAQSYKDEVMRQPRCLYMANPGPCKDRVKVWGYDFNTNRCVHFFYGGCGGNPNRFYKKQECIDACYMPRVDRFKRELPYEEDEDDALWERIEF